MVEGESLQGLGHATDPSIRQERWCIRVKTTQGTMLEQYRQLVGNLVGAYYVVSNVSSNGSGSLCPKHLRVKVKVHW